MKRLVRGVGKYEIRGLLKLRFDSMNLSCRVYLNVLCKYGMNRFLGSHNGVIPPPLRKDTFFIDKYYFGKETE